MKNLTRVLLGLVCLIASAQAFAHKPSDSYLTLHASTQSADIHGRWDIALRDLELALQLDANHDGAISWGEVRSRESDLFKYAFAHLTLRSGDAVCVLKPGSLLIDDHSDGAYAVLMFDAACAQTPSAIEITYSLMFDIDPTHRGLLRLDSGSDSRSAVLGPDARTQTFTLAETSRLDTFMQFVGDGIHHIWIGYDHMLFLISLLLPSVLVRRRDAHGVIDWVPVATLRGALLSVLAVVTAFTISHSITLTLAALGVVGLPSRLVESAIALSVMLAALNNIKPVVTHRAWVLAGLFGLVHGFGFASVLADLGLPRGALALSLAGFNIGVEIGQLSVVLVVVPLIYLLRAKKFYRPVILVGGSVVITLIASIWFFGRIFGFGLG